MKRGWYFLCALCLVSASISCGGSSPPPSGNSTGGAGGGTAVPDLACQSQGGCVRGDVELTLHCTAPDDGSGVTSWDSVVAQHPQATGEDGGCFVSADGRLSLGFGSANGDGVAISPLAFLGGGPYELGGQTALGQGEQLDIKGTGHRGDASGLTNADTSDQCGQPCELDVLPHDRPAGAPGEWITYRFVVTCNQPLGTLDAGCGQCVMEPKSFTVDAACYFQPPQP